MVWLGGETIYKRQPRSKYYPIGLTVKSRGKWRMISQSSDKGNSGPDRCLKFRDYNHPISGGSTLISSLTVVSHY